MDEVKAAVSVSVRTAAMRSKMEEWGVDGEFFVSFFCFARRRYNNKLLPIYAPQPVLESTIPIARAAR